MRKFLVIAFLRCGNYVLGQDTVYFDDKGKEAIDKSTATYHEVREFYGINYRAATVKTYSMAGKIKSETEYDVYAQKRISGKAFTWYDNGKKKSEINYKYGYMDGKVLTYWDNGEIKRNDFYKEGNFVKGNCFTQDGRDTTYYAFEMMPQFPGGESELFKFLRENVKYPRKARDNGISGRVYVSYIIDKDGSLRDIKIIKGISQEIDEEAMRVIKLMPKWIPGMQDGIAVQVQYNIPINFKLD